MNALMRFFKGKDALEESFDNSLSVKIKVSGRVRHRSSGRLGTCIQTGLVNGSARVPAISVQHDDGTEAWLVPAEEYTTVERRRLC